MSLINLFFLKNPNRHRSKQEQLDAFGQLGVAGRSKAEPPSTATGGRHFLIKFVLFLLNKICSFFKTKE